MSDPVPYLTQSSGSPVSWNKSRALCGPCGHSGSPRPPSRLTPHSSTIFYSVLPAAASPLVFHVDCALSHLHAFARAAPCAWSALYLSLLSAWRPSLLCQGSAPVSPPLGSLPCPAAAGLTSPSSVLPIDFCASKHKAILNSTLRAPKALHCAPLPRAWPKAGSP